MITGQLEGKFTFKLNYKNYRYGADIVLRKKFEEFLVQKQVFHCGGRHRIPIICVALEGGIYTLNSIYQYLTNVPAVPVIICEGSGRVSDFLAIAQRNLTSEGLI